MASYCGTPCRLSAIVVRPPGRGRRARRASGADSVPSRPCACSTGFASDALRHARAAMGPGGAVEPRRPARAARRRRAQQLAPLSAQHGRHPCARAAPHPGRSDQRRDVADVERQHLLEGHARAPATCHRPVSPCRHGFAGWPSRPQGGARPSTSGRGRRGSSRRAARSTAGAARRGLPRAAPAHPRDPRIAVQQEPGRCRALRSQFASSALRRTPRAELASSNARRPGRSCAG